MTERTVEFWCRSPLELGEVFAQFSKAFPAGEFTHDTENVWEWFCGQTDDALIAFNITRQWDEEGIPDEPVRMSLRFAEASISIGAIGHRLAEALGTDVHTGKVCEANGNEFAFDAAHTFRAPPFGPDSGSK